MGKLRGLKVKTHVQHFWVEEFFYTVNGIDTGYHSYVNFLSYGAIKAKNGSMVVFLSDDCLDRNAVTLS